MTRTTGIAEATSATPQCAVLIVNADDWGLDRRQLTAPWIAIGRAPSPR